MDSSDAAAEIVAEYSSIFPANYASNAAAVIFIYEYLITIGEEAKYFWNHKFTGASALFFLNRYIPLALYAMCFISYAPMSDEGCAFLARFDFGYGILPYIFWAAFSSSRAFALTNRNWILSLTVCSLSLVPVFVNIIVPTHYGFSGEMIPLTGCAASDSTPLDVIKRSTIVSRTSLIAADSLLIFTTWFSLFRKGTFRFKFGTATLAEVLLRDGTIYFVVLVVLNVLQLALTLASIAAPALQNVSDVIVFTEPFTAIIVQRFLLHLQAANRRALDLDSTRMGSGVQRSSSLVFNRAIGSLGASIHPEDFLGSLEEDGDTTFEDELEIETGSRNPEEI